MPNDKNQFGYVENAGMGIAGYEDRKDNERNPQNKNTPPVTVQGKKEDRPVKKIDPPESPVTEDQDDDVLIFLPNEKKKERPLSFNVTLCVEISLMKHKLRIASFAFRERIFLINYCLNSFFFQQRSLLGFYWKKTYVTPSISIKKKETGMMSLSF